MNNFTNSFIGFVEGYFTTANNERDKDIVYKRFGINSNRTYTLEELGILHDGLTRERIRQIESNHINKLKILTTGKEIKRFNYICDNFLVKEMGKISDFFNENKAVSLNTFKNYMKSNSSNIDNPNWGKFFLKILGITILSFDFLDDNVLVEEGVDYKTLSNEIEKTFKILKQHIIYMPIEDIIIESKKGRRKFDTEYIKLAIKCLDLETLDRDNIIMYAVKVNNSFAAGDLAYRVLWEEGKPLSAAELFTITNKKLKQNQCSKIKSIRNMTNQIVSNENIINIGAKKWALKEWNIDKKYIKEMIKDVLLEKGKPLEKDEIVKLVKQQRHDVKAASITSYLTYDDFRILNDGTVILAEWKGQYVNEIKNRKSRQYFINLILQTFRYYQKNILSTDEMWDYLKTKSEVRKSYIKNYLLKKSSFIMHRVIDSIDYWILKEESIDMIKKGFGNKLNEIKNVAEQILLNNNGSMKLIDLRNVLVNTHKFHEKSIYRALSDQQRFTKHSLQKGKIIITLRERNKSDNIKLTKVSKKEFEEFIAQSKSEEALFDFKQGFLNLSNDRKFDNSSFEKIMKNVCAMANHGIGITGRLFIGICDKVGDAKRIEYLDRIKVTIVNGFGIAGIEREAIKLGYDLEKYQNYILGKICASKLPDKLKNYLKSNIGYIHYKGKYILMIEVNCIDGLSLYDKKEVYIRKGPNLEHVNNESPELHDVYRRCFKNK